jgi:hypothetical protein
VPTQNSDLQVNNTISHTIGGYSGEYFDGEMAEVNLIDGQALTPYSFGTYNSYGVWQPITYGGSYGTNGFYLPFPNNGAGTSLSTSYLAVGGGGGGGGDTNTTGGGGGGAGGYLASTTTLNSSSSYVVTVGAGGSGGSGGNGTNGGNSQLGSLTAAVGGGYGAGSPAAMSGNTGGSGGGGKQGNGTTDGLGGAGTSGQGTSGGYGTTYGAGGGGGATSGGTNGGFSTGGNGGAGTASSISGSSVTYAGGGGGGSGNSGYGASTPGTGGAGGGGNGGGTLANGNAGTANLGGGGGGSGQSNATGSGAAGGSGVVIVSYAGSPRFTGGTVTSSGGNTIHTFTSSGVLTSVFSDYSPQNNNWTGNNINVSTTGSTYDSLTDVPTLTSATVANYAVWNPLGGPSGGLQGTLSNGNLTWTSPGTDQRCVLSTIPLNGDSTGKWYWEVTAVSKTSTYWAIGVFPYNINQYSATSGYSQYRSDGVVNVNTSVVGTFASYTAGDVIGMTFDASNNQLKYYKNNTLITTQTVANSAGYGIYAGAGSDSSGSTNVNSINFGQQPFVYTPPTGFLALNTYNL